jgi:hypothetical protein
MRRGGHQEPQSYLPWNARPPLDFVFCVSSLAGVLVAPLFMLMAAIDDTIRA